MTTETKTTSPAPTAYPQMIVATIKELNEKNGSTKADISKHMESNYPDLPPAHSTLLSNHLDNLKDSGELVLAKNCYMILDPNAAPKRGRGRPPKEKAPETAEKPAGGSTPAPRGRQPKAKDAGGGKEGESKPRGRPPKVKEAGGGGASEAKRPRGRPPKKAKVDTE